MSAWKVVALMLLLARPATAQLSIWDTVRDPGAKRREAATVAVEHMLWRAEQSYGVACMERNFSEAASTLAGLAHEVPAQDTRLAFYRGRALSSLWIRDPLTAKELLMEALSQDSASALAGDGWFRLGIAAACSGDLQGAVQAYMRALERVWEPGLRSEVQLELAETLLAQGAAASAVAAFDLAARSAMKRRIEAQAYFGIAAALERSGRPNGSLTAARTARAILLPKLYYGTDDVLEFPALGCVLADGERQFRRALGTTAVALEELDLDVRVGGFEDAIAAWDAFLGLVTGDRTGRFRAEVRRAQCREGLREASSELARLGSGFL